MGALAEKIRKARQSAVSSCGHRFTIRRPTHLEVLELQQADGGLTIRNVLRFVVGWDLKESDLIPGGVGDPAPFDVEAFEEWAADHPDAWADIMKGVASAYQSHAAKLEEDAGN